MQCVFRCAIYCLMPPMNSTSRAQQVVRIQPLPQGYAVQVYDQTVMRAVSQQEALRLAEGLRRAFR
jgi:hypothetical protein